MTHSYAPAMYLLGLALAALLTDWHVENVRRGRVQFDAALTLLLFVSVASPLAKDQERGFFVFKKLDNPFRNAQEVAFEYARRHPGTAYFPWNPLATLLAEGRADHFDYGLYDRELAGFPVSPERVRVGIPARMKYVCFPPKAPSEFVRKYLPMFSRRVEIGELPGWACYER
jgi:hypothetical protein